MKRTRLNTFLWGLALLLIGVAGLLYNFGVFADYKTLAAYIVAGLLALGGVGFLVALAFWRDQWLFVIPGCSLLALAGIVYLTTRESVQPMWLGALFLGGMAAGFLILFLSNRRERWWALLQASTIAVIALVGLGLGVPAGSQHVLGAALFGGFALIFLLLFLVVGDRRHFLWALVLAGVLAVFAFTVLGAGLTSPTLSTLVRLWPVLAIVAGALFFFRLLTGRAAPPPALPTLPAETLEKRETTPTSAVDSAPARITRPDRPADRQLAPPPPPQPSAPSPANDLPENLRHIDPKDPAAALDALLDASKDAG